MQRVRKLWWTVSPLGSKIEMGFALNFVISLKCHESFSPGVYTVDSYLRNAVLRFGEGFYVTLYDAAHST